ncbi:efflux transporter outer membrane subunit [Methylomonas sp. MgM2]
MSDITRPLKRLAIASILLTTSACAWFGEDSQRAEMMALPKIDKTLASAQATVNQWPSQNWWTQFADPALDTLISTAIADNPDIKVAEARLRQSQAMVDAEGADLYPTIDANVSFSAQRYSANSVQAKFAGQHFRQLLINPFILRYHLDFWGRDQAALQGAVNRSLAAAAELADAQLLLAAEVAGAYFDLQAATERLALAERIVADRVALEALYRTRLTTGLSGDAPLLQAESALHAAKQLKVSLESGIELLKHRLAALAGKGADWGQDIPVGTQELRFPPPLPGDLPLHLLSRRPDLSAARLQAEAAAEEIDVAEAEFYPDINLIAFTGLHSASLTDILLQGSSLAYAVGPSIELPIFQGGRLRANLSHSQAAYDAAVERYNASLVHAIREVADALSRWREFELRLAEQREILTAAQSKHRLGNSLVKTGLADQSALLQTRIDENRERLLLATLSAEMRKASVAIIKSLGGGYDDAMIASQTQ